MRNRSENQVRLVLVRHGATKANEERRYLGKTEEALSPRARAGLQEAKALGLYPAVDCLFSSPMKRCLETAEILYPDRKPMVIPRWAEIDFGDFEGKNYSQLQGDARYQAWIDSGGRLPFPGGESREEFILRSREGFFEMLERLRQWEGEQAEVTGSGEWLRKENFASRIVEASKAQCPEGTPAQAQKAVPTLGIIAHGGTIMALLSGFCGGDYFDYQVANGGGYVCTLEMQETAPKITGPEKLEPDRKGKPEA